MDEQIQEEEVSLNPQELETASESQEEAKPEPKKVEVKSKAEEVAENYKIRAEKAEKELKRFQVTKQPQSSDSEWKNKVEFLIKNRDCDEEEFDHIATVATRKGISLEEAAKAEKDYIDFRRQKVNSDKKIPSPSSAGFPSFEKKITPGMPQDEMNKILEERAKKAQESNSGY